MRSPPTVCCQGLEAAEVSWLCSHQSLCPAVGHQGTPPWRETHERRSSELHFFPNEAVLYSFTGCCRPHALFKHSLPTPHGQCETTRRRGEPRAQLQLLKPATPASVCSKPLTLVHGSSPHRMMRFRPDYSLTALTRHIHKHYCTFECNLQVLICCGAVQPHTNDMLNPSAADAGPTSRCAATSRPINVDRLPRRLPHSGSPDSRQGAAISSPRLPATHSQTAR